MRKKLQLIGKFVFHFSLRCADFGFSGVADKYGERPERRIGREIEKIFR